MTNPETLTPGEWANHMLDELQLAACVFHAAPRWTSPDGKYSYLASIALKAGDDEPDYIRMEHMSGSALNDLYPHWRLGRFSPREATDEGAVQARFTAYLLGRDVGMLASDEVAVSDHLPLENTLPESAHMPTHNDYKNVGEAIAHLRIKIDAETEKWRKQFLAMSQEERRHYQRNERALKYSAYFPFSEQDKTAVPKWWGISVGSMAFAVKASSGVEALLDVEDVFFDGKESLLAIVAPHTEEAQREFDSRYTSHGSKTIRVIPFSSVEYPEDPKMMTDEQKAAFDKLNFENEN